MHTHVQSSGMGRATVQSSKAGAVAMQSHQDRCTPIYMQRRYLAHDVCGSLPSLGEQLRGVAPGVHPCHMTSFAHGHGKLWEALAHIYSHIRWHCGNVLHLRTHAFVHVLCCVVLAEHAFECHL